MQLAQSPVVINAFKRLPRNELLLSVGCIVPHKSLQTGRSSSAMWQSATRCAAPSGWNERFSFALRVSRTSNRNGRPRFRPARPFNHIIALTPDFCRAPTSGSRDFENASLVLFYPRLRATVERLSRATTRLS